MTDRVADLFRAPLDERYFEDYIPGSMYEFGSATINADEIVEFGRSFDPQSFHTDAQAAMRGPFGGLIASGWHTAALMMRLFADNYLSSVASLGGPGVDELRWLAPVRPGDVLRLRARVVDTKVSRSKPDRGLVRTLVELANQNDVIVLRVTVLNLLKLRNPGERPN